MKKKEVLIVIIIILITLFLAFYPKINLLFEESQIIEEEDKSSEATTPSPPYIFFTIDGNVINNPPTFKFKKGVTWSNVKEIIILYIPPNATLPSYPLDYQFNTDTTITIGSSNDLLEELININTASKTELMSLPGIGEKKAERIIEYRKTKKILSFDELKNVVGGLSDANLEEIKTKAICK